MRFLLVLRRDFLESKKSLLIYSITICSILFVLEMIGAIITHVTGIVTQENQYLNLYPGFLFLGGCITTSVFFAHDMFSKEGQHNWLLLPATQGEKFLSKALLTAIAYPLVITALFALSSLVIESITLLLFKDRFWIFNPFTKEVGSQMLNYVVLQSIFLLGATFFRKAHFVKTVLALIIIAIMLGIIGSLFVRIIFAPYFDGLFMPIMNINISTEALFSTTGKVIFSIIYWAVLPLFCWWTAYLRVTEVQSTDAV